jgi:hypothetical protein
MDCACPDFFPIGDRHMLISHVHRPWNHLQYYIGRLDQQAERFLPEQHGFMSWPGGSLCAPETLLDGQGRRLLWGWIMEADGARADTWASVATLPRVLSLATDHTLRVEPAPELQVLRTNPRQRANLVITGELALDEVRGECLELDLVIERGDATEFGLIVRRSPDGAEQTPIVTSPGAGTLRTELTRSTLDPKIKYSAMNANFAKERSIPDAQRFATEQVAPFGLAAGEAVHLRVFLDRSVLEVFANDRQCLTQRLYPSRRDSLGVSLFSRGGTMKVVSLRAWDMSPTNSW